MKDGAPSNVARSIFDTLYIRQKNLPFDEIIIFTDLKFKEIILEKFGDIKILSVKELFKIEKDDLIHIPVSPLIFPNTKFLLYVYAKIKNNKIIMNYHGDIRNEIKLKYKFENKLEFTDLPTYLLIPSLLGSANKVVVNSDLIKNIIVNSYGVKSVKIIPNAVDNCWFTEDKESMVKDKNVCDIFYHGRLSPEKGVDVLIKGFNEFLSEVNSSKKITLYIAGEGSQGNYLQQLAQRLKIDDKIVFLGSKDRETIKEYLKRVDGAIYPSIWDGFSLSILEALASANCPVFISKKAGITDFLTEEDVLNVFNPDTTSVKNIFRYIFENTNVKNIVMMQKKFAERYTWNKVANYYIELYNEIIEI